MISPPPVSLTATELPRGALEALQLFASRPLLRFTPTGDGHPVIVIPGFGGASGSTQLLRNWLIERNYDCRDWGQGRNFPTKRMKSIECALKFRAEKVAKLAEDLGELVAETGKKASLIGWSLGGIYAHELASQHPALVRRVVTLGTPFGDPRGTALWPVMARRNGLNPGGDVAQLGEWLEKTPPKVPTTVIHSSRDGFVAPEIARLDGPLARHIHVNSSHIGLPANPRVFWHIAHTLAHAEPGSAPRY